jgi:hypothetical protein
VPTQPAAPFATMIRHLNLLKRALERQNITVVEQSRGKSYIALRVAGLSSSVTCLTNPDDAHRWWYRYDDELLTPAGDAEQAQTAATKLQELRAGAPR